jgi:ABC-type dipeptide/oligopeptide/nickel transport system permease component
MGRRMGQQIAYRLLLSVPVLCGVLVFGFLLIKLAPGDPAMAIAGPSATPDVVERIRQEMGLDQPAIVQFWRYVARVAQGDLGRSMINNTSVAGEFVVAIAATAELMVACLAWAVPLGIALGTVSAVYQRSLIDRAVMAVSVAGVSMPVFFIGLLLMMLVGYRWQLLLFLGRGGPLWSLEGCGTRPCRP